MKIAVLAGPNFMQDKIFDKDNPDDWFVSLEPMRVLKKDLEKEGHEVRTLDLYDDWKKVDLAIVYSTFTSSFYSLLKLIKKNPEVRLFYYAIEPEIVVALNNKKILSYIDMFDAVLTYRDDYVDNEKFFKIYYAQPEIHEVVKKVRWQKKKLLTVITSRRRARYDVGENDLYKKRTRLIKYFAGKNLIDIYGKNWNYSQDENIKRNYKGMLEDHKHNCYSKYKFAICFENEDNVPGWVSEKIFSCLVSGCVPIYKGCSNIEEYVDKNCFIDYGAFGSKKLEKYILEMKREEYEEYMKNISKYLKSQKYKKQLSNNFSSMVRSYMKTIKPRKKKFYAIKLRLLKSLLLNPKKFINRSQRKVPLLVLFYW